MKNTTAWIEDDSSVIDAIEAAKAAWFEAHPQCDVATSEKTDEYINLALDLPASGAVRPLADCFDDWTEQQITNAVHSGLNGWWNCADVRFSLLVDYAAPPAANRFEMKTIAELTEIKTEIDGCDRMGIDTRNLEIDEEACNRAIAYATAHEDEYGKSIYVAQDEDGYYFATTR